MNLLPFLKKQKLFSEEDCAIIDRTFGSETIPKGEVIRKENKYSKRVLFIESGLLRTYYVKDGKDITHFFFDENDFIAPVNSIYYDKSERYEWEAVEECKVRMIKHYDFLILEEQFPKLTRLVLDFAIKMLDIFSQKLNLLQFQTAADRYKIFLDIYPNLMNRVSLGDTASFLGVTQQTLSVVRSRKK